MITVHNLVLAKPTRQPTDNIPTRDVIRTFTATSSKHNMPSKAKKLYQCASGLECCPNIANETGKILYQLKHGLLDDYLIHQLKNPALKMEFA